MGNGMKKVIGIIFIFFSIAELIAMYPLFLELKDASSAVADNPGSDANIHMSLMGFSVGGPLFLASVCGAIWCLRKKPLPQVPELDKEEH